MSNEIKVTGKETVEIEFILDTTFHKKGDIRKVHPVQAEKFVASKKAKLVKEDKK